MGSCMPDAMTIGTSEPRATVHIVEMESSEIHCAILEIVLEVQGAIRIRSTLLLPPFASWTCSILPVRDVITSFPVAQCNNCEPINLEAERLRTGMTSAPCLINSRAMRGDSIDETLPVMHSRIFFPSSSLPSMEDMSSFIGII